MNQILLPQKLNPNFQFGNGIVPITSPDQFVPLFLAQLTPNYPPYECYEYGIRYGTTDITGLDISEISKEQWKKELMTQLNHPYPDHYTLPMRHDLSNCSRMRDYGTYDIINGFFGLNNYYYRDGISILGCVLQNPESYASYIVPKVTNHYKNSIEAGSYSVRIKCSLLIVVKAKHIPYLRARIYLQLPIQLPYGDLKVLKGTTNCYYADLIMSSDEYQRFIRNQQPIVEYADSGIPKILYGGGIDPLWNTMPRKDYIQRALRSVKNTEIYEPV